MVEKLNPMTFPLKGTRLIEASAGTGKTYTIAALYLRLVLGHGGENAFSRPLTPPEILVVTFTNAATEELRDRIRSRLAEAARFFRGTGDGDDFLLELRNDFDKDELPTMALRLDQAAQWMDEAAIYTIHAWCQRMLRQHAFDSLSLFDLELAPSDQDLLEEAACDFWRAEFYPQSVSTLAELKAQAGISTPQELLKKVLPVINAVTCDTTAQTASPFALIQKRQEAIELAREVWAKDFEGAIGQIRKAQADKTLNNNKYRTTSLGKWIEQMDQWVNHAGSLPGHDVLGKFSATGLIAGKSKNGTPPAHGAYDALDRLIEDLASFDIKSALIHHAAKKIQARVIEAKDRLSRMGFNDLLTRMNQALTRAGESDENRLARVIREQFPVAMIDEFQDTDPLQYNSFGTIYLNREDTGFFMIGDPKQAIYAFRGADIHTYLKAKQDTGGRLYTLEKNYRSTRPMVNAVNHLFDRGEDLSQGVFLFRDEIPFDPVAAQGRQEKLFVDDQEVPAMTLWQMDQDGPLKKTGPEGYIQRTAQGCAREIARLIRLGEQLPCRAGFDKKENPVTPLRPSDIAVLVRNGSEAAAIRAALSERGVKSVYLSDSESVFASPEALSLLYILQACSDPSNDGLVRTALATDLMGLSFGTLDRLNGDELAWETELQRFKQFQAVWHGQGVLPMIRRLLSAFNIGARMLADPSGERRLTNVLHLGELIQSASVTLDGEQAVIRWLAGQIENAGSTGDEQILRLESDQALVRVVTIHKSKGLEYPLVFLPFICGFRKVTAKTDSVVKIHDPNGQLRIVVNPEDEELEAADHDRLAEDLRILYVALTRARYACWLGMGVTGSITQKNGEKTDLHGSAMGYLLKGGEMILTDELPGLLSTLQENCDAIALAPLPDASQDVCVPEPEAQDLAPARTFSGTIPKNWRISSYSGILAGAAMPDDAGAGTLPPEPDVPVDSPDSPAQDQIQETFGHESVSLSVTPGARSIHTFARGPEPGTFLHDMLEWAAHTGFDRVAQDPAATRDKIRDLSTKRGWESWSDVLSDWLLQLIQIPLPLKGSESMALADLGTGSCKAEMEFLFAAHSVDIHELDRRVTDSVLRGLIRPALRQERLNGMLKGFIDLVFRYNDQFFVLDYKSNYLGEDENAYGHDAMAHAMTGHRYDLQYVLYILALHRLLKARLPDYDYDRDVGGAVYLFLRGVNAEGQGVYTDKPPADLIHTLDHLFKEGTLPMERSLA